MTNRRNLETFVLKYCQHISRLDITKLDDSSPSDLIKALDHVSSQHVSDKPPKDTSEKARKRRVVKAVEVLEYILRAYEGGMKMQKSYTMVKEAEKVIEDPANCNWPKAKSLLLSSKLLEEKYRTRPERLNSQAIRNQVRDIVTKCKPKFDEMNELNESGRLSHEKVGQLTMIVKAWSIPEVVDILAGVKRHGSANSKAGDDSYKKQRDELNHSAHPSVQHDKDVRVDGLRFWKTADNETYQFLIKYFAVVCGDEHDTVSDETGGNVCW